MEGRKLEVYYWNSLRDTKKLTERMAKDVKSRGLAKENAPGLKWVRTNRHLPRKSPATMSFGENQSKRQYRMWDRLFFQKTCLSFVKNKPSDNTQLGNVFILYPFPFAPKCNNNQWANYWQILHNMNNKPVTISSYERISNQNLPSRITKGDPNNNNTYQHQNLPKLQKTTKPIPQHHITMTYRSVQIIALPS